VSLSPEQLAEMLTTPAPLSPANALLTEIKDLLVQQNIYLRLVAADVERRALPMVFVPDGEVPFKHYKDHAAELAAARAAEIALVRD
jgi:hypothetical protein